MDVISVGKVKCHQSIRVRIWVPVIVRDFTQNATWFDIKARMHDFLQSYIRGWVKIRLAQRLAKKTKLKNRQIELNQIINHSLIFWQILISITISIFFAYMFWPFATKYIVRKKPYHNNCKPIDKVSVRLWSWMRVENKMFVFKLQNAVWLHKLTYVVIITHKNNGNVTITIIINEEPCLQVYQTANTK